MGSLVLVGRCYLRRGLSGPKRLNAVCPIATVMLYFDASQYSHSCQRHDSQIKSLQTSSLQSARGYAAIDCLLFRSGSYTSPVIHKRCNSTANFRATAITARFLAFFPPRAQMRCPKRRRSLSFLFGPRM
jgi:hypothetical protein